MAGIYTFELTVSDGTLSSVDTVNITVVDINPVANAGEDRTVSKKTLVELNGTASHDMDGDPLTFSWTQTSGPSVGLGGGSTPRPTFTPPVRGIYVFRVTVSDGDGGSATNSVEITATNSPPVAEGNAPGSAQKGTPILLSGVTSSDPDGDALAYGWEKVSGPSGSLTNDDTVTATFTPSEIGRYTFRLTVNDSDGSADNFTISFSVWGLPPIADIVSTASTVEVRTAIQFNGSASHDPDGTVVEYTFDFGDGTQESGAIPARSHIYSDAGMYTATLTVKDNDGNTSTAKTTVKINSPAQPSRDLLADIWWLIVVLLVLIVAVIALIIERRKWKARAMEAEQGVPDEEEDEGSPPAG